MSLDYSVDRSIDRQVASPLSSPLAGGGGAPAWQPSDLYAGSDDGAFLDFTTIGNLFQADQTTPVASSGQLIGKIADMSGKGNHFLAVASNEPTWYILGGIGSAAFGPGKWLEKLIAKPTNYTIVSAIRASPGHWCGSAPASGAAASMWGHANMAADGKYSWLFGDGTLYSSGASDAAVMTTGVDAILAQTYTTGSTKPKIYNNAGAEVAVTRAGGTATSVGGTNYKCTLGRLGEFASTWNGGLYGQVIINRVLTAPDLAKIYDYFRTRMPA